MQLFKKLKLPKIKRYIFAVETHTAYTLLGVWGWSDEHVKRKLQHYIDMDIISMDPAFGQYCDREVDKFPSHVTWII